jgi:hypothetical protein
VVQTGQAPQAAARRAAPAGVYRVVLTVDGVQFAQSIKVENDPNLPQRGEGEEEEEEEEELEMIRPIG